MWQLPDRIVLAVHNTDGKTAKNADIQLDLDALNLTPKLPWQEFIGVRQLVAEEKAPPPILDFYGRRLTLKALPPAGGRVIGVRRY